MKLQELYENTKIKLSKYYLLAIDKLKLFWNKQFSRYEVFLLEAFKRFLKIFGWSLHLSRFLFRLVHAAVLIAGGLLVINILLLPFGIADTLGPFGDFFGGMLNPIFTFLMLIGLIVTIVLQKTELSLARKEFARTANSLQLQNKNLEIQRFESTFFKLLDYYEHCRNDVQYISQDLISLRAGKKNLDVTQGRDAFKSIYGCFTGKYLSKIITSTNGQDSERFFDKRAHGISGVTNAYAKFYSDEYGEELGQYFLTIYNILKFIDKTESIENKKLYSNLLRAQLSRYELLMMFYNVISIDKEDKMKVYLKRYAIMKHLELKYIPKQNRHLYELVSPDNNRN